MVWKPHVTVAAVIEQNNRFLLVEEHTPDGLRLNQPAGHLEENEDLISAVKREVSEETAWQFEPENIVSVQLWRKKPHHPSFLRFTFCGRIHSHDPLQPLDDEIIGTHWLSREAIAAKPELLRSPLVLICVDNYLSGQRYPLSMLQAFFDLTNE
ncbi:NUDIX hydrolase [Methylomarinum vadi]|uniref:NUDIX hydrolase n=1 Tax=Methylomarinum vadi TaxID=438855 RepID=UPI0004DF77DB|nr:NUDIX hydrolase [Methylomarinum vadi]